MSFGAFIKYVATIYHQHHLFQEFLLGDATKIKTELGWKPKYTFMVSKNLVKFTTYDDNKNKVAFRQHTFVGKSRKNHRDAKNQTAINLKSKIRKLGIFNFIGVEKK